ncbi:hypothetical protein [Paeniglutamicibacter terrestris]|uniref:Phage holin family protein n=1 Tax=Paeniglutamicibacter terrestris TaxID=2723403 RepID=A0ABX1G7Z9_9MICC|nr:hypothetical protein [Paeniglutamicibacter terrestris]NKG22393.1 hypothetical protein [Paeniglutamicibacter terrestris]
MSEQGGPSLPVTQPRIAQHIDMVEDLNNRLTYQSNLGVVLVATTKDKIDNVLHRMLPKYRTQYAWQGPLGIMLTLILTMITAEFRPFLGVSAEALNGACGIATIAVGVYTGFKLAGKCKSVTQDDIVDAIVQTHDARDPNLISGDMD